MEKRVKTDETKGFLAMPCQKQMKKQLPSKQACGVEAGSELGHWTNLPIQEAKMESVPCRWNPALERRAAIGQLVMWAVLGRDRGESHLESLSSLLQRQPLTLPFRPSDTPNSVHLQSTDIGRTNRICLGCDECKFPSQARSRHDGKPDVRPPRQNPVIQPVCPLCWQLPCV